MAICLGTLAYYFWLQEHGVDVSSFNLIPFISLGVYLSTFALRFGPIPSVTIEKLFSQQFMGLVIGIVCVLYSLIEPCVVKTYQILLEAARRRTTDDRLGELKDDIHSISVTDEHRTTDDRLGALEEAVRSLTAQFAAFAENRVKTHHATTKHAPTSLVQQARNRTWCYYHERYGSDARKCGSDQCTFAITKKKPLKNHQTTMKLNGNYYQRFRENV